jgi:ribosomal protein L37AE/L43A
MIIRWRKKPLVLQKYDALVSRLRPSHPGMEEIKQEQAKYYRGYIGEKKVDYYTDFLADEFTILYDVCLDIAGDTVQMDTVIVTPHAIFIIDSKNFRGTVTFDSELEQLTRDDGEVENGYLYPPNQVELQKFKLQQWLRAQQLPNIPIHYFIAISEPNTIINVIGDKSSISKVVSHAAGITSKLLDKNKQIENSGTAKIQHRQIGNMLLKACKDHDKDIMAKHNVKPRDLLTGVHCPKCGWLGMERVNRGWKCKKCNHKSRRAHWPAIKDYLLLDKPWITNSECMRFLNFNSKNIATRIMKDTKLTYDSKRRRWFK